MHKSNQIKYYHKLKITVWGVIMGPNLMQFEDTCNAPYDLIYGASPNLIYGAPLTLTCCKGYVRWWT